MAVNIRKLTPGTRVIMQFHGSAELGNTGWTEIGQFDGIQPSEDGDRAFFRYADDEEDTQFEVYNWRHRWRYGTSAEVFTVAEVVNN